MSKEYLKLIHDVFPETEIEELSEYKEEKNDSYEHYSVLREATDNEIPREASPGPNVQYENESNQSELSMSESNNGEVIVELSEGNNGNKNNQEEDLIEINPDNISEAGKKLLTEEELSAISEAEKKEKPDKKSVGDKSSQEVISEIEEEMKELQAEKRKERQRKKTREKVENWDPRYGKKVEEMTAEQFSDLMAKAQEGKTLEEELEQEVDNLLEEEENEEELSSEPDPETAKEAVEAWKGRNDVFAEFASTIEEENDIQGEVEELEEETERDSTPVETHVKKHGNGNATVESNDPQIKSELRDVEFAEILNESGDMVEAKVTDYKKNMGER